MGLIDQQPDCAEENDGRQAFFFGVIHLPRGWQIIFCAEAL